MAPGTQELQASWGLIHSLSHSFISLVRVPRLVPTQHVQRNCLAVPWGPSFGPQVCKVN